MSLENEEAEAEREKYLYKQAPPKPRGETNHGETLQMPLLHQHQDHLERPPTTQKRKSATQKMPRMRQEMDHQEKGRLRYKEMNNVTAAPEVQFRVGEVRVALWPSHLRPDDPNALQITIERSHDGHEYTSVLTPDDITKTILALKKAANYIRMRKDAPQNAGEFTSADIKAAERVP